MPESTERGAAPVTLVVEKFTYGDQPVRIIMVDDEPWFVLDDICRIVGRPLMASAWSVDLEDRMKIPRRYLRAGKTALTTGAGDVVWFVSETGFYDLVLTFGNTDRKPLKRWVTHEVLPTIRHTGSTGVRRTDLPSSRRTVTTLKRIPRRADVPHALYRLYDEHGTLLYIGISLRVAERMREHEAKQPWWTEVATARFEPHLDKTAALLAEAAAIQAEHPKYNVRGA